MSKNSFIFNINIAIKQYRNIPCIARANVQYIYCLKYHRCNNQMQKYVYHRQICSKIFLLMNLKYLFAQGSYNCRPNMFSKFSNAKKKTHIPPIYRIKLKSTYFKLITTEFQKQNKHNNGRQTHVPKAKRKRQHGLIIQLIIPR